MKNVKLTRFKGNPILKPINKEDCWWQSGSVFNPGAIVKDNKIYLLYRALGSLHYSSFGLAILKDPTTIEKRLSKPVLEPESGNDLERFGIEDPRIVYLEGQYRIVYVAASAYSCLRDDPSIWGRMMVPWKIRCCLLSTQDFSDFKREGVLLPELDTKNGTLFPEKVGGKYVLLHRLFPNIWISFSDRLDRFPQGQILCKIRNDRWDNSRIGAGAPPIKTRLGWLEFYHGVDEQVGGTLEYQIGILLLDLHDPTKILYRSEEPILEPIEPYEKKGYVNNVVFPTGVIEWEGKYYIYYGGADRYIGVAWIDKEELLGYLADQI